SDCVLREGVTMSCGSRIGGGITAVGDNGYFMAMSHVGHDCHVENDVTFANGAVLGGHSHIGQGVIMGGLSAVQQFCRVGLKRRGLSREAINAMRAAFKAIFLTAGGSLFDRARRARDAWPGVAEVQEITAFILADARQSLCVADPARVAGE